MPELGCKSCGNCTWLDGIGAVEQVCIDCKFDENGHPTNWRQRKPKTNADRIRSMSDEELADFLCMRICFDCNVCSEKERLDRAGLDIGWCDSECDMHCFEWLQQPWEEQ